MAQESWYVMEDGSLGDPHEMVSDRTGKLTHKDGRAVAYNDFGPRSRSVDPEDVAKARAPKKKEEVPPKEPVTQQPQQNEAKGKDMQPEDKPGYKTRESKSRK